MSAPTSTCPSCGSRAEPRSDGGIRCLGTNLDLTLDHLDVIARAAEITAAIRKRSDRSVDEVLDSLIADLPEAGAA